MKAVVVIFAILILLSLSLLLLHNSRVRDHGEGMYITDTYGRLTDFSYIIRGDVQRYKIESLPREMDELLKWFYARHPQVREIYERENWLDSETGAFIDAWGNPIELKVNSLNEYTFISAGPNQQFEHGKGDDITYSFNPYLSWAEEEKQKD